MSDVLPGWNQERLERLLGKQGAAMVAERFSNKRDQEMYDAMRQASPERQRIAALVALCEDVIEELSQDKSEFYTGPFVERLARLKGEE